MSLHRRILGGLRGLLQRQRAEQELDEELSDYLATVVEARMRAGLGRTEAMRVAHAEVGSRSALKDRVRDVGWEHVLELIAQDVRSAWRAVFRHRLHFMLTVATVTLAVGANLVVFTIINALWLRPRAIADESRVVMLVSSNDSSGTQEGMYFEAGGLNWIRALPVFSGVAGQVSTSGWRADDAPHLVMDRVGREVETQAVTSEYFSVLGVPILGRDFWEADDRPGAPPVVIISNRLWRTAFNANPAILGAKVPARPLPVQIIGVAPASFHGVRLGEDPDLWLPVALVGRLSAPGSEPPGLLAIGRLAKGVSAQDAERAIEAARPYWRWRLSAVTVSRLFGSPSHKTLVVEPQGVLWIAGVMAALVLVGGCATLMALAVAQFERRRQEFAIRLALGSARGRLIRVLALELGFLGVAGVLGALFLSGLALKALPALSLPGGLALSRIDLSVDWRVAAFGALTSLGALAVSTTIPLARSTRPSLAADLVSSTGRSTAASLQLRRVILGGQVAATIIVLIAAGLFVRTVLYGVAGGAGFDTAHTVFVETSIPSSALRPKRVGTPGDPPAAVAAYDLIDEIKAIPGVSTVALGDAPLGLDQTARAIQRKVITTDDGQHALVASGSPVGLGYFDVLGVPLIAGRPLDVSDIPADSSVKECSVVITKALGDALWPGASAVGQQLRIDDYRYDVVGVAGDLPLGSLHLAQYAGLFVPFDLHRGVPQSLLRLAIRTTTNAGDVVNSVRRVVASRFRDSARTDVATGREVVARDLGQERLGAWAFSGFGLVSLVLGIGGICGLVVSQIEARRRELGIRLALGAQRGQIVWLIVVTSVWPVAIGAAAGLLGAAGLARTIDAFLLGVGRLDSGTYALSALLVLLFAAAAAFLAATRATRVAASEVLQAD